jgi:hypothetical protein
MPGFPGGQVRARHPERQRWSSAARPAEFTPCAVALCELVFSSTSLLVAIIVERVSGALGSRD